PRPSRRDAGHGRSHAIRPALSPPALGRHEATRGDRPRARQRPGGAPDGRAARGARRPDADDHAGGAPPDLGDPRQDGRLRHAFARGGAAPGRSHRAPHGAAGAGEPGLPGRSRPAPRARGARLARVRGAARDDLVAPARGGRARDGRGSRMTARRRWLAEHWIAIASPITLLLVWEWASATGLLRAVFFPRPSTIAVHLRPLPP